MKNKDLVLNKLNDIEEKINEIKEIIKTEDDEIIESTEEVLEDDDDDEIIELTEEVLEDDEIHEPIKKALIVGINKYLVSPESNLSGCVNDAYNIKSLLTSKLSFLDENILLLTDFEATKQNIMDGLEWLINGSKEGDELVFTFSGHGSQVADTNSDEVDTLDEIICTTDLDWNDPFTDDILSSYFTRIPEGVFLTFICDSCHSGTINRGFSKKKKEKQKFIIPPEEFRPQFIIKKKRFGIKPFISTPNQDYVLLAGCAENDYSSEGLLDGKIQGALTWILCKAVRKYKNLTWERILPHIENQLKIRDYTQVPQLVTKQENYSKKPFRK